MDPVAAIVASGLWISHGPAPAASWQSVPAGRRAEVIGRLVRRLRTVSRRDYRLWLRSMLESILRNVWLGLLMLIVVRALMKTAMFKVAGSRALRKVVIALSLLRISVEVALESVGLVEAAPIGGVWLHGALSLRGKDDPIVVLGVLQIVFSGNRIA